MIFSTLQVTFEIQTYHTKTITTSDINIFLSELFFIMTLIPVLPVWIAALIFAVLAADDAKEVVMEDGEGSGWVPTPVLKINESAVLKLDLSVIEFAAMLHEFDLDLNHGGVKINPDLLKNARVARTKEQLRTALHGFVVAVQPLIPDFVRSNQSENTHARSKRSILGWIATTGDLDSMTAVIEYLKGSENQILNFQDHLVNKVNALTDQMAVFIRAGKINMEEISRSVLHLESEVILTAWSQACDDAIRELQLLTTAVLGKWAPTGLFHPLERGKLLSAHLTNETFHLLFFLERFYAVMADCRQLTGAPPLCRMPGPIFFRPGTFRQALTVGIETKIYSEEKHAVAENPLGEAPVCRVKKVNDFELPYFCWGKYGFSGKADSPTFVSTSWHAKSIQGFELKTAELTRKFGLGDKIWKHVGLSGISRFARGGETIFPPWAWVLTCSVAAVICVSVGVGIVWAKMRKNEADMQKVIGDLKTEVNDLRGIVLTFRARASEQDESVRAKLEEIRSRFRH